MCHKISPLPVKLAFFPYGNMRRGNAELATLREGGCAVINYNGKSTHTIDAKGRICLPAKFRKKIANEETRDLIVRYDFHGECLYLFTEEDSDAWIEELFAHRGGYDGLKNEDIRLMSMLRERSEDVTLDSAGRINIPKEMLEGVGIDKEALLIGNRGFIEIWDAKRREEAYKDVSMASFLH